VVSKLQDCNAGLFENGAGRSVFVYQALGSRIERK